MSEHILDDRRRALEEAFFAKHNEMLRQRLNVAEQTMSKRQDIIAATGIDDPAVLDRLMSLNIGSDTLAALALVPLVAVAWADGSIDAAERNAILASAAEAGLKPGSVAHELLQAWLGQRPTPALIDSWKAYIGALDRASRLALKDATLARTREVALSAGGILGFGKVAPEEEAVIHQMEAALA